MPKQSKPRHLLVAESSKKRANDMTTLAHSSQGWHEGNHDPWPNINYTLSILKMAYTELEQRLGQLQSPKGEKTGIVLHAIDRTFGPFRIAELQNECPTVSADMIRRILKVSQKQGRVECLGRGQNAQWRKTGKWQLGNAQ